MTNSFKKYKNINLGKLDEDEVLFFIRIRGKESYFKNVYTQKLIDIFESINYHRCISEYKKDADVHIDITNVKRDFLFRSEFNELVEVIDIDETIARCRGLRAISYVESKKLINRAFLFFKEYYTKNTKLKFPVMVQVYYFLMDIMVAVGEKYGVKFLGITDSFMSPEYKLSTVRGELNDIGKYTEENVEMFKMKILYSINNPRLPSIFSIIKKNIYFLGSATYRFLVRYIFLYKLLGKLDYEYRFAPYLNMFCSFNQLFAIRLLEFNHKFSTISNKKAYIPLHYYPEATIDYWCKDIYDTNYLTSILNTVRRLQKLGYTVYVKEHPHYFLSRNSEFYKILIQYNCILLSPFVTTKRVFDNIDLVVVWNGSTGIESMVYGKKTVRITNSYYGDNNISTLDDLENNIEIKNNLGESIAQVYKTSFHCV